MERETKRLFCQLIVALIVATLPLGFAMSARAQETNTANPQTTAPAKDQAVATPQEPSSSSDSESVEKTSYFGPIKLAWDNTVKYSTMFRVAKPSNVLINPAANTNNVNQDDGDRDFHRGLVQNRVDILSEMDISFGEYFGVRGSMAAWGDAVYNQRTNNDSPYTWNALSSDYEHFPHGTKELEYMHDELLDAFAHAKIPMGKSTLTIRAGQFTQQWGQTLFFGSNGIAGAMAPIDLIQLLSIPNAQFKQIIRPVPQVAMVWQYNDKLSFGAYYQLEWRETRFPGVGSYFSTGDVLGDGAETFWFGQGVYLTRVADMKPKNYGQFGGEVLYRAPHGWDLGFYAVQFHDKTPQIYVAPGMDPAHFDPMIGEIGSYTLAYQTNIKTFGVSASKTVGIVNWAAEFSGRTNQDLTGAVGINVAPPAEWSNGKNALYPIGDTLNGNLSALASLRPNFIAKESDIAFEAAWNDLVSVTKNAAYWDLPALSGACGTTPSESRTNPAICNSSTHNAVALMAVYTPTYRQVVSGLDVSVPVGINISPYGRSVLGPGFATYHGGFFNIGAQLAYKDANRFTITYQRFLGPQIGGIDANNLFSYGQSMGDRNYISLSIYRTFGLRASQKSK